MKSKLLSGLFIVSVLLTIIGGLMKIQHWTTYGGLISSTGIFAYIVLLNIEISSLKKIIEKLKNNEIKVE